MMHHRGRGAACFAVAGIAWFAAIGSGFFLLEAHRASPGAGGEPAARWASGSRVVPDPGRANLVLAAHPRCPCTRATIAELARLMARCRDSVAAHVLFVRPGGAEEGWERGDLWRAAAAIPGARVYADPGGRDAARFGAASSGHVLLYDASGALLYSGGITESRGHEGDNPGRDAVISLLRRGQAARPWMPVFGCSLSDAAPAEGP